ncbi:hypothetical protein SFRURICE_001781, partial [Spodoptera frugiperda]
PPYNDYLTKTLGPFTFSRCYIRTYFALGSRATRVYIRCSSLAPQEQLENLCDIVVRQDLMNARLARWLGNWLPCSVSRVRFPHGTTLCVIHRLLFRESNGFTDLPYRQAHLVRENFEMKKH